MLPESQTSDDVESLKRQFATVARRNLFEVFLRPKRTVVKLISTSASSSSAFPQGEALRFTFSAYGQRLLGLSSSRVFLIDLTKDPISVTHELKILRRPVTAAISDDGASLAVVSSEHQVHVYALEDKEAKLTRTLELTDVPRALAFSPRVAVLAVAYDEGIEVHALGEDASSTARRAIRCFGVTSLSFSRDGSTLLGSTNNFRNARLVTISPPLLTDPSSELSLRELQSRMWTSQILFPEISEGYSHVGVIPPWSKNSTDVIGLVGYDCKLNAFRVTQVDDTKGGIYYFVGPGADIERDEPRPSLMPAISENGEFLTVSHEGSGLWIYRIPESLTGTSDAVGTPVSETPQPTVRRNYENAQAPYESTNSQRLKKAIDGPSRFVSGYPFNEFDDISAIRWVHNPDDREAGYTKICRLVGVAPGGVESLLDNFTGERLPVDSGRIILFDFERSATNGKSCDITIEVGEVPPINLPEQGATLDVEVELQRRRTHVNRRQGIGARASTVASRSNQLRQTRNLNRPSIPPHEGEQGGLDSLPIEEMAFLPFLDNPYSNTAPRSGDTLRRAATAATRSVAASRYERNNPPRPPRREFVVPHESDADNWVPPPPPYTPDADGPLPEDLRRTLLPTPGQQKSLSRRRSRAPWLWSGSETAVHRLRGTNQTNESVHRSPAPREANDILRPSNNPPRPRLNNQPSVNHRPVRAGRPSDNSTEIPPIPPLPPLPHLPPLDANPMQGLPPAVIGRNGPSHHLTTNTNTSQAPFQPHHAPAITSNSSQTRQQTPGTGHSGQHLTPVDLSNQPMIIPHSTLPDVPTLPIERRGSETNSFPGDTIFPSGPSRLYTRGNQYAGVANTGVERSRSRSQDVPRRRPLGGNNLFDRRTGRRILTSQSDAGLNAGVQSDELREQWDNLLGEKKKKKDTKCVVM